MIEKIPERITALRAAMLEHGVDDYLVTSSDEHLNEYLPLWRARREFLSGFTGSAGDLLVGKEDAWLYTDGRYHLQAETELQGSGVSLMKVGEEDARTLLQDVEQRAKDRPGLVLGVDPMVIPVSVAEALRSALKRAGGQLREVAGNLVDPIWTDRPTPAQSQLIAMDTAWAGRSPSEKIEQVRADLKAVGAESIAVVKLDQIAWLLNLRSTDDVPYNPVFEAFLFLDPEAVHVFLRGAGDRLPDDAESVPGLVVHEYADYPGFLAGTGGRVMIDAARTTAGVVSALKAAGCDIVRGLSPLERQKAIKNEAEQAAQLRANLAASVVKTRALLWLRREVTNGNQVTEESFKDRLEALYCEQKDYHGLSFNTIAATGPHGAIIHYGACDATPLEPGHLFLIDSGAHIGGGTTDDTRTVAVGTVDAESRRAYTLVLKGHIGAARQVIPDGSNGSALDALARAPLWNAGLNYDHGTGHGVGAWLCVHEGPFSIAERGSRTFTGEPLRDGAVSSIEPGYYKAGWGGVRIENLYVYRTVEPDGSSRKFLRLEPITWIPFDPDLIDDTLLNDDERTWIADYHQGCVERLSPLLPEMERYELQALIG